MNEIMEAVTELNKMRGERAFPLFTAHPRPHSLTLPAVSESVSAAFPPILTLLITTSKPPLCVREAAGTRCTHTYLRKNPNRIVSLSRAPQLRGPSAPRLLPPGRLSQHVRLRSGLRRHSTS